MSALMNKWVYICEADRGSPRERGVLCSLRDRAVAHGNYTDSVMSNPSALKGGHITERLGNCLGRRFVLKCCGQVLQPFCTYIILYNA